MMSTATADELELLYSELNASTTLPSRAADIRAKIERLEAIDDEPVRGEWDSPGTSPRVAPNREPGRGGRAFACLGSNFHRT
jgi:hypothetical protein